MADYFLEAKIAEQRAHLINLLFADDENINSNVSPSQFCTQFSTSQPLAKASSILPANSCRPTASDIPSSCVQPPHLIAPFPTQWQTAPSVARKTAGPHEPIIARQYTANPTGGHHVEETVLSKLPDRVLCRSANSHGGSGSRHHHDTGINRHFGPGRRDSETIEQNLADPLLTLMEM